MASRIAERTSSEKYGESFAQVSGSSGTLTLVPSEGFVLFPYNTSMLHDVDSLVAEEVRLAHEGKLRLGVIPQKAEHTGTDGGLGEWGTEALVTTMIRLPNGQLAALIKGLRRFRIEKTVKRGRRLIGVVRYERDLPLRNTNNYLASVKVLKEKINRFIRDNEAITGESLARLSGSNDGSMLCDLVAPFLTLTLEDRQALLMETDVRRRMRKVSRLLDKELQLQKMTREIHERVQDEVQDSQRKQFLRQQLHAIRKELGDIDDDGVDEADTLALELEALPLPDVVREQVDQELSRLDAMPAGSSDQLVSINYLGWIRDLPWGSNAVKGHYPTLKKARSKLDMAHFGLENVKDRVLEHLAVICHKREVSGQNILLYGPPGVGKTSLAESIAEVLGRPLVRISLGGMRDEAEIRGHRRTYVGALPGKLIQAMKQAKCADPIILLDEIDKVATGPGGGVESALLEVLDPEQNKSFTDHFLAVPYDLSKVLFVGTANSLDTIPSPLLDRFEKIEMNSYSEQEKLAIAKGFLVPSIRKNLSLKAADLSFTDKALLQICRDYARESGVRQLKRDLTAVGRKVVRAKLEQRGFKGLRVKNQHLLDWLGKPRYFDEPNDAELTPGVAIGLAYTSVGGDILYIESARSPTAQGKMSLRVTGRVGKVMDESAQTALSFIRAWSDGLGIERTTLEQSEVHLHFPDGATPKDGPSAGVAIMLALISLFSGKSLSAKLAVTGEITLRGHVLPVGGIREKVLAAHRYGKTHLILPSQNRSDVQDIPDSVIEQLTIHYVDRMFQAVELAGLGTFH